MDFSAFSAAILITLTHLSECTMCCNLKQKYTEKNIGCSHMTKTEKKHLQNNYVK